VPAATRDRPLPAAGARSAAAGSTPARAAETARAAAHATLRTACIMPPPFRAATTRADDRPSCRHPRE